MSNRTLLIATTPLTILAGAGVARASGGRWRLVVIEDFPDAARWLAVLEGWRRVVEGALGREAPARMGNGTILHPRPWSAGYDPLDSLDKAILRTEDVVYPQLGLTSDPYTF